MVAPKKSLRPKSREQVGVENQMRQFGNLEFRADMDEQLKWNPLARLGFEPDQSVVGRPKYNSPDIYEGIRYPYYAEQEYIDETLPDAASGVEYTDVAGRVKPGSVIVNSNTAKNPVWSHEYTHGGIEKVIEYLNEDREFFTEKYGKDTVKLLDAIQTDTDRAKGPNEKLTEMLDDVSKDAEVDIHGHLIPAAGTALGGMDSTRTAVEDVSSRASLQEYLKKGRVGDNLSGRASFEASFPGYSGIFKAAEDMLEKQGEPLPSEKRGWWERKTRKWLSGNGLFNEGGDVASQTEEALGWTAEGKKFADENPVEVAEEEPTALSIADVPVFDRPMDASENDKWTGVQDELGNREYITAFGRKYFVRLANDQRTNYEKIQQDIIPAVKNYLDNPTAPSREQTINFLKESLGAAWETFKIPGDLAAGNKGMGDVTLGNIFELAGGTGAASTVGKVPGGDSSNTLRTFGGSNPPTYELRKKSFSSQVNEFSESTADEYADLLNTNLVIFREPISEFAETVNIPKKGLLGSEFLNLIKKNDSIPETSLQEGIIDPQKRYSREELLSAVGKDSRGLFSNVANIATDKPRQFEGFQRQIRDAGFKGGMEIDYFDIPISSSIGYPGKPFQPNSKHYDVDTLVHVRGSIVDPSRSDLSLSTLNPPNKDFAKVVNNENYLLVEEIQSDLLTKGYLKPGNKFDKLFKKSAELWESKNEVSYSEIFGSVDKELKSIVKELHEENVMPPRAVDAFISAQKIQSKLSERGFLTTAELKSTLDDLSTVAYSLKELETFVDSLFAGNKMGIIDYDTAETVSVKDFFKSYEYKPYKTRRSNYLDKLAEKLEDKKISKEVYTSDLDDLYLGYYKFLSSSDLGESDYGLPPIRKNKQAVDEALKILIAKAAQSDVDFIVIPPAERIALARGRDLKKDKGDRFYRTYVTDLEKSLSELEANYPVKVFNAELPYRRHEKFVGFVPDTGDSINTGTSNTGTIIDISELVDKYKIEEPRQFAQGGGVGNMSMKKQMSLFEYGGIADDGMNKDPVSGNNVPPGSLAKEVRDDIPAMLSEGEYVVPADVLRYYGVNFFENLRGQAKQGLNTMEQNGRIGGTPMTQQDVARNMQQPMMTPPPVQAAQGAMMQSPMRIKQQPAPQAVGNSGIPTQGYAGEDGSIVSKWSPARARYSSPMFQGTSSQQANIQTAQDQAATESITYMRTHYNQNGESVLIAYEGTDPVSATPKAGQDQLLSNYPLTEEEYNAYKSEVTKSEGDGGSGSGGSGGGGGTTVSAGSDTSWMDGINFDDSASVKKWVESADGLGMSGDARRLANKGVLGLVPQGIQANDIAKVRGIRGYYDSIGDNEMVKYLDGELKKAEDEGGLLFSALDKLGLLSGGSYSKQIASSIPALRKKFTSTRDDTKFEESGASVYKPGGIDVAMLDTSDDGPGLTAAQQSAVDQSRARASASRAAVQAAFDDGASTNTAEEIQDFKEKVEKAGGTWNVGGRAEGGLMTIPKPKKKKKSKPRNTGLAGKK